MEKILTNTDILIIIFDFLQLQDQITLSRVCVEFKDIIVRYLWQRKYCRLHVYQLQKDLFVLSNEYYREDFDIDALKNEHFECLQQEDIEKFLYLQRENILILEISDCRDPYVEEYANSSIKIEWKFPKLKFLKLNFLQLQPKQFSDIKANCTNLEVLHLYHCKYVNGDVFTLKDHNALHHKELLDLVKTLTAFNIEYTQRNSSPYVFNLHEFLLGENLKKLIFNIPIDNIGHRELPRLPISSCEQLQLAVLNEYQAVQNFCHLNLNIFENLQMLSLEGSLNKIFIDTSFIAILGRSAKKLKHLKLQRCLLNVTDFNLLRNLQEIYFENCMSLTWQNLKQLLETTHLKSFQTYYSTYVGEYENFSISPSLENLTLIGNEDRFSEIFVNSKQECLNLKCLRYYDGSKQKYYNISQKFPNLEILYILPHQIDCQDLLRLNRLKVYDAFIHYYDISFDDLLNLIKHPSLRELSLTNADVLLGESTSYINYPFVNSNLKYITINYQLFNNMLEFWLNLLKTNLNCNIIVHFIDYVDLKYCKDLLTHPKFCRKYIKICGFQLDKHNIFTKPEIVKRKLEIISQLLDGREVNIIL